MNNSMTTIRKGDHVTDTNPSPFPEIDKFVTEFLKTRKVLLIVSLLFVIMNYNAFTIEKQYLFYSLPIQRVKQIFFLLYPNVFSRMTDIISQTFQLFEVDLPNL
jgi:hypothetical protein